ncbi:cupin domain-containing protein [Polynucleobacter sp. MG-5-Ahmo-C2]|jgi:quercetin dioxygenase-like cupin family protein|uniref:cupin domain-containing protein n=1 Tax=unclassified Polynucleobacter TaxID=2640945 RepID=UPI001BFD33E6|nr:MULTISPECIES: cupin domain-containing protein [unclassified Polynucleobacter]QWD71958.1 cupin domain-containing protein [Polynucleobacter sp. UB-Raua-W9]QWD98041.1 cupin domain-containing protein [Polynucleobacter sp. MG-5-Ahmo-C2]
MKISVISKIVLVIASCVVFTSQVHAQAAASPFVSVKPDQVVWGDAPAGVKTAVLYGDPTKPGMYVVRNIFPEGIMSSPHSHSQDRFVTVIKGTWYAGTDASWDPATTVGLPAGSMMFHPAGVVHFDGAMKGATEIQIIGMGPVSTTPVYPNEPRFGKPHKLN